MMVTALNDGRAVEPGDTLYPIFVVLVFGLSYLYFSWFWTHGGQSLGMKTWRIKLQNDGQTNSDQSIGWKTASIRFISALFSWGVFGLGFVWSVFDKKNRCWHDISSKTVLIDLRTKN